MPTVAGDAPEPDEAAGAASGGPDLTGADTAPDPAPDPAAQLFAEAAPETVPPSDLPLPSDEDIDRWIYAYLRHAPLSLTLREINRLIAIETVATGEGPILDVGCGDGFWWMLRDQDRREVYGIDISAREIAQARTRINAALSDVSRERPFPDTRFQEIIGNCSLEHVPDIDGALSNLRRAAAPGARLLMFVPTPQWALQGKAQQWLLRRYPRVAMSIAGALNGFFQHWHLYDAKVWRRLLAQHGWRVRATYGLGSARSEFLFRLFMPPAFLGFLAKKLTGFYPAKLARYLPDALLAPSARLVRWAVSDPLVAADSPTAYEYLIVAEAVPPPPGHAR
ncbi:MAG TPA: class I SAM-dependent methyltransferase [Kofleriaceae bacterium]|nr:class I SAM-dependent methyltransferase [Kofleriaceae bacterium]